MPHGTDRLRDLQFSSMMNAGSGDRALMGMGKAGLGIASSGIDDLRRAGERKDELAIAQANEAKQDSIRQAKEAESLRRWEISNTRQEETAASLTAKREAPKAFKPWRAKAEIEFDETMLAAPMTIGLVDSFIDDFGSEYGFGTGSMEGVATSMLGGFATDSMKAQNEWWEAYDKFYTLETKHKLFGSALTKTEIAAWDAANISRNMDPAEIKKRLKVMRAEVKRKVFKMGQLASSRGHDPSVIRAAAMETLDDDDLEQMFMPGGGGRIDYDKGWLGGKGSQGGLSPVAPPPADKELSTNYQDVKRRHDEFLRNKGAR